jgi:hypothetical protein
MLSWTVCARCVEAADLIGNPTPSDYFQQNLREALVAAAELHVGMKQLSADIEAARSRYFSAAPGSAARATAGDPFARLLNDKDLLYANLPLTRGLEPAMLGELELPFIDNGIPEDNRPTYIEWLRAVRKSMGAGNDKAQLLFVDPDTFGRALDANVAAYASYQLIRDRTERWQWNDRIGKPELNTDDRRHDMSRINLAAVPAAVKATLGGNRQFGNWQKARFYSDAKGSRYLVYFGRSGDIEREFLFDAAGESTHFEAPASQKAAAAEYDDCQRRARQANLVAPYFSWYAQRCQFGPLPPTDEEVKQWQHDGPELERLQAEQRPPPGNPRLQAEFSLKNYRCEVANPITSTYSDPLVVPRCIGTYQFTEADQKQLEAMVRRLSH